MSAKTFKVVFITSGGRVVRDIEAGSGLKAVEIALKSLDAVDCTILGVDADGRAVDAKHWKTDEDGLPASAAKTEGLVLRTVTTVERVTA